MRIASHVTQTGGHDGRADSGDIGGEMMTSVATGPRKREAGNAGRRCIDKCVYRKMPCCARKSAHLLLYDRLSTCHWDFSLFLHLHQEHLLKRREIHSHSSVEARRYAFPMFNHHIVREWLGMSWMS